MDWPQVGEIRAKQHNRHDFAHLQHTHQDHNNIYSVQNNFDTGNNTLGITEVELNRWQMDAGTMYSGHCQGLGSILENGNVKSKAT